MNAISPEFETKCRDLIDRFFAAQPNNKLQKRAHKALRMLRASDKPLKGKAEGWATGIIYAVHNDGCIPCGVPGMLNSEFVKFMNVSMETTRYRAARVMDLMPS